jgi:hypothetical protein
MKKYFLFLSIALFFAPLSMTGQNGSSEKDVTKMQKVNIKTNPNAKIIITTGVNTSGYTTPTDLKEIAKDTQILSQSNDVLTLSKGGNSVVLDYPRTQRFLDSIQRLKVEAEYKYNYGNAQLAAEIARATEAENKLDTSRFMRRNNTDTAIFTNKKVAIGGSTHREKLEVRGNIITNGLYMNYGYFDTGLQLIAGAPGGTGHFQFGDNTGWKMTWGRRRESPTGASNSNLTGILMTLTDKGELELIGRIKAGNLRLDITKLPVFADDTAATTLQEGDVYRNSAGQLFIKL